MKMLVASELAPQSIVALAVHTLTHPLRGCRLTAYLCLVGCVLVLLGASPTVVPGIAQTPERAVEDGGPVLTAQSGLLMVPLHVYKNRKSISGLGMQAFELVEDGIVQDIAFVEGPGGLDDPATGRAVVIEIILLIDTKNTMKIDLLDTRRIRHNFFEGVRDNVAISVYGFAGGLKRLAGPTRDIGKIQIAFEMAYSAGYGHIPILDAIIAAARDAPTRIRNASRKLVVYSRGLDPSIFGAAAHSALDFEIPIYDLAVNPQEPSAIGRTILYSFRAYPLVLGRPGPRAQAAPQEFPVGRYQNPRSAPYQKCCPLGMEMIPVHKRMGLDAPYRANSRNADPKHRKSMLVRAYLESLARLAQNEYFVGYYPSRKGDEPVARNVEVRLKNKRIGQLYGGRRVIVY